MTNEHNLLKAQLMAAFQCTDRKVAEAKEQTRLVTEALEETPEDSRIFKLTRRLNGTRKGPKPKL